MKDITNNLKNADTWNIQLTIAINFMSFKDTDGECLVHSKSDNIEIMINDKADEVISRYQIGLETTIVAVSSLMMFIYCITK